MTLVRSLLIAITLLAACQSASAPATPGTLPTLAVLPTLTVTRTPPPTAIPTITPTPTNTALGTQHAAPSQTITVVPSTATDDSPVTLIAQQSRIRAAIDATATALASFTPPPGFTPTADVLFPPPATLDPNTPSAGGAQGTALNIETGDLYVLTFARPAEALIAELGGSVTPAPAGQTWVLLEMLLICTTADNCAPESIALVGGTEYPPAEISALPPFSAAAYDGGQVYGYAGFLVPDADTNLSLSATRAGTVYTIALRPLS
jgi:hypothetical protein